MRNLRLTTKVSKKELNEVINNKKYDVVLFIVDTDYDTYSENISKYYHRTIERFKSLGMRNVLFASYDINENGVLIGERVFYKLYSLSLIKDIYICSQLIVKTQSSSIKI